MFQTPVQLKQAFERWGRWAVVTGASSGIGAAFARRVASMGLDVVLVARSEDRLREVESELKDRFGVQTRVIVADLSVPAGAEAVIAGVDDLEVGLLVSNAGDSKPGRFIDTDIGRLRRDVQLNALSHMELIHHFAGPMARREHGAIVVTSASGALHGMPNMANAGAAKAYGYHLAEALFHELRSKGVDVTTLLPGNVDTPIVGRIGLDPSDFPLRLLTPDAAVDEAFRALARGIPAIVPGRTLRTILRLSPRRLSVRINGALMGKAARTVEAREGAPAGG